MQTQEDNQPPFVSVVIPCYNGLETIGECLSSIENQTYARNRYEVILADNGSKDGTCNFVRNRFPSVKLIHSTQKGSGYARNAGILEATGEFVLSTDSDCVIDRNWITTLVKALSTAPVDVAAFGGKIVPYSTKTAVERYPRAWVSQPDVSSTPKRMRYAATPNACFRSEALRQVGAFDGTLGFDDTDLGIRLGLAGYRVEYTDQALVRHRNPATIRELYQHKLKYSIFNYWLAKKHPGVFGGDVNPLLVAVRRIAVNCLIKQPLALVSRPTGYPRSWPLIDATIAAAYYAGHRKALAQSRSLDTCFVPGTSH